MALFGIFNTAVMLGVRAALFLRGLVRLLLVLGCCCSVVVVVTLTVFGMLVFVGMLFTKMEVSFCGRFDSD